MASSASRLATPPIARRPPSSPMLPPILHYAPSPSPPIRQTLTPIQTSVLPAARYRLSSSSSSSSPDDDGDGDESPTFDRAVRLFNAGDYHRCHDVVEELWYVAEEPVRTVLHGVLQCAVGFHHLFNQNHRGAMMELGEGLCKLRKMDFEDEGPFFLFEKELSAVLEFLYQTQKELAACTDDICLTMDGSERSYQLLGSFAAGQRLYRLDVDPEGVSYLIFSPNHHIVSDSFSRIKVPTLHAKEEHLKACEYRS